MIPPRRFSRRRISVAPQCVRTCPSCTVCGPSAPADLQSALPALSEGAPDVDVILGGGDVTTWPHLEAFVDRAKEMSRAVWIEAPIGSLTRARLGELSALGVHGVRGFVEAAGTKACAVLRVGDPDEFVRVARESGLAFELALLVRPRTLPRLFSLPTRYPEVEFTLELVPQDWSADPVPHAVGSCQTLLENTENVRFAPRKQKSALFVPPCALPTVFAARPDVWGDVSEARESANSTLDECQSCALRMSCHWAGSRQSLGDATPTPVVALAQSEPEPQVPAWIRDLPVEEQLVCTAPWTMLEVADPTGTVNQCCSEWTNQVCGRTSTGGLRELWNGPGYRRARQSIASGSANQLCRPVCPRLHDRDWAESKFRIYPGSERFEANQRRIADDLANRASVSTAMPTHMTITSSSYCNYDCIMCMCGRSPRRELPQAVWDELPEFLPYLWSLNVLGGEPLADPRVTDLLRTLDVDRYPDLGVSLITNGSLLNRRYLQHIDLQVFRGITISLNAGTPEAYLAVQRGVALEDVLLNLDELLKARAEQSAEFSLQLSFVVQPEAIHTLPEFGALADERGVDIRLLPMTRIPDGAYYYTDQEAVDRVLHHLTEFEKLSQAKPLWQREILGAKDAVRLTAAAAMARRR